ncbi:LacI family DNA-binding transcriptional regulator [Pontibacter silvestris]|uniref:LacI family DNA-binding transcriptional regulator n=1 Tax=Pontibacter silvestris TaxID=2305183 RepID=A0ABW4X532_9BACT|nr:substrate-binding domain-containing protein [Pontibacter silvestris]MCC9134806.1 substrate-binding domain-containing protein [Pontibacter silvestris]
MKRKVSLKDIAQHVGVSTALVSYVLNNQEKEKRVGEEMAARIRKAAGELNYQPNQIAKSLKSGKTYTIGLIVADISNPYSANIARIIEDEAKRNGYTVIFGSSDENADKSWDLINVLLNRQVDGFIIAPSEDSESQILYLKENNIPVVLIDRYFPSVPANYVAIDNCKAAYEAVMHLIRNGYRRIGMITYKTKLFHLQERVKGYQKAIEDSNLLDDQSLIKEARESNLKEEVQQQIDELLSLSEPIDALFFASNKLAVNGLKHIKNLKIMVPEKLAIVGFDETEAYDLYHCPITYVKQPMLELGRSAVKLLLDVIKDDSVKDISNLDTELIIRESSGNKK